MHDDPIDLTPLDPDADPGAEERFVGAVMSRISARGNPYPVRVDALWGAWSLARPILLAASLAIAIAGSFVAREKWVEGRGPLTVAESLGVPPEFRGVVMIPASGSGGQSR